jgi:hypothetical protein
MSESENRRARAERFAKDYWGALGPVEMEEKRVGLTEQNAKDLKKAIDLLIRIDARQELLLAADPSDESAKRFAEYVLAAFYVLDDLKTVQSRHLSFVRAFLEARRQAGDARGERK